MKVTWTTYGSRSRAVMPVGPLQDLDSFPFGCSAEQGLTMGEESPGRSASYSYLSSLQPSLDFQGSLITGTSGLMCLEGPYWVLELPFSSIPFSTEVHSGSTPENLEVRRMLLVILQLMWKLVLSRPHCCGMMSHGTFAHALMCIRS